MKRLSKFVGIAANYFLAKIGLEVRKIRKFSGTERRLLRIVRYLTIDAIFKRYLDISKSQFGQDLLVLKLLQGLGSKGFFVEFGAVDGLTNSNSFLLEKELGWKGIVSEPARRWHAALKANRTCSIDTRCVYSSTGEKLMCEN